MARRNRRGIIVVLAAVLLVVMLAMIAFAVDVGFVTVARTELQGAADAAALAGVARLPLGEGTAAAVAQDYAQRNLFTNVGSKTSATAGQWNSVSRQFTAGATPFDALQVQIDSRKQPLFFGRVMGTNSFDAGAAATAIVRPRDMVLVLDYSGSMNDARKIKQLKSSVNLFLDILDDNSSQDRVAFVRYSTDGKLVEKLTYDVAAVNKDVQKSSADGWTNIGEGMELGRKEIETNARHNASKLMILMTDGLANRPEDRDPKHYVLDEAEKAKAAGIDVYAISFGSDADHSLMEQVADICDDVHFAVEGSVSECETELRAVFVKIATKWKIQLVQ